MSSISRWPFASRQAKHRRIWSSLPRMTRLSCARMAAISRFAVLMSGGTMPRPHAKYSDRLLGSGVAQGLDARDLCAQLTDLRAQLGQARAVLGHHVRGRVAREFRIGELALELVQVDLDFALALGEPLQFGRGLNQ